MLKIGVTGGIGSGKTIVCRIFRVFGIPVFDADNEAKKLMTTDADLVHAIRTAFGEGVYLRDGTLNRSYLSAKVFSNDKALQKLNTLVHPVVIQAGEDWAKVQRSPYTIKEAALLFESGSYEKNDYNILVSAPMELRMARVIQRDGITRDQVTARMDNQLADEEKSKMADFVLVNDGAVPVIPQVLKLHEYFLAQS